MRPRVPPAQDDDDLEATSKPHLGLLVRCCWSGAWCAAFFAGLLAAFVETTCAGWFQGAGVGAGLADGGD